MIIINIILSILASYRLSRMIVAEEGPFSLFDKIRGYIMSKYSPDHWLYNGISCPLCLSFWTSLLFSFYVSPDLYHIPLYWLGIAGAVVLIYRRLE